MEDKLRHALTAALAPFDRQALAGMIGALHLVPINMERAVRLHTFAHAVAALPPVAGLPVPTLNRLRAIVQQPALRDAFGPYEDPYENAFSETLEVGGDTFIVVNGSAEGFPEVLRYLLSAVEALPIALPVLATDLTLRVKTLLRLVDATLRRAEITANAEGVHGLTAIEVPASAHFSMLRRAVTFRRAEFAFGIHENILADVTTVAGTVDLASCEPGCSTVAPFLDFGNAVVLVQPTVAVEWTIRMLLRRVTESGAAASLNRAFHDAVLADVRASLLRMEIPVKSIESTRDINDGVESRAVIEIDGTLARLIVITDAVGAAAAGGEWAPPQIEPAADPLTFAVYQSFARPASLIATYDTEHPVFALTAVDLRTLAVLEDGDPLALMKYVRATAMFKERSFLFAPTTLAGYYVYWLNSHGYYVTDEGVPGFVNADAAGAAELREIARRMERLGRRATYAELSTRDQPQFYNPQHLALDVRPVDTVPALPRFRGVKAADQELLMDELAAELATRLRLTPGPIATNQITAVLNEAVTALFGWFRSEVAELSSAELLEDLLLRNEALIRETIVHRAMLPGRAAAHLGDPAHEELARDEIQVRINTTGALRFLIEYVVAQSPAGSASLTLARLDRLQAVAAQIIQIASMSDLRQFGVADFALSVLPTGRLSFSNRSLRRLGAGYATTFAATEMLRVGAAIRGGRRKTSDNVDDAFLTDVLSDAVEAEFSVTLPTLRRFFVALVDFATAANPSWFRVTTRDELLLTLAGHGIELGAAERLVDRFTLLPRREYLKAVGFKAHDIYPWRVNRKLSHRRRPLAVRTSETGAQQVLFTARHIMATWRDLIDQFVTGSYPAETRAMEVAKGKITKLRGEGFNTLVAEVLGSIEGAVVQQGVKKIVGRDGVLHPPGDFDVLVAIPASRRLIAVECKDIAPARDVFAQSSELKELIVGDPAAGKKSYVDKQRDRLVWLKTHLVDALKHLRVPRSGRWSVEAVVVTSEVVPTPFLRRSPLPVVSAEELRLLVSNSGSALRFNITP
ncbi:MAG TPA: hypothetical protein VI670_27950 [Thermoanaerobaculia bacterium]|jgi:hypothetical protein